jgi:hypothetical protein
MGLQGTLFPVGIVRRFALRTGVLRLDALFNVRYTREKETDRPMKKTHIAALVTVITLTLSTLAEHPLVAASRRAKVEELKAVSVIVDHYAGEEEDAKRFETEVELRLQQAGLRIENDAPTLMLGRSSTRDSGGTLIRRLQAELQETGSFKRGEGIRNFSVVTWESTLNRQTKAVTRDTWASARTEFVAAVDEFLNDLLATTTNQKD